MLNALIKVNTNRSVICSEPNAIVLVSNKPVVLSLSKQAKFLNTLACFFNLYHKKIFIRLQCIKKNI